MQPQTLRIAHRFRGPTASSNGGYCCGALGRHLSGAVQVTLRKPPPLDKPLALREAAAGLELYDGDLLIAQAKEVALDLEPIPAPPTWAEAEDSEGYVQNVFPECFVCGRARRVNDGLRIFAGPVADGTRPELMVDLFVPDASLPTEDGALAPEIVWAALDCPGYAAATGLSGVGAVLGRMTAQLFHPLVPGQRTRVTAWPLGQEGRKLHAGTALFGEDDQLLACSRQTWIVLAA